MELNVTASYHPLLSAKIARDNNEFKRGQANFDSASRVQSATRQSAPHTDTDDNLTNQRINWSHRVIEAQASRVIHNTDDAVVLKPITIESQPSNNIRQFLQVARNGLSQKLSVDIYV